MSTPKQRDKRLIDQTGFTAFIDVRTPLPISCVRYEVRVDFNHDGNIVIKGIINGYVEDCRYQVDSDMLHKWINAHAKTTHDQ